jgi:KaiC/GvpD/RAD55 family RecA-like ATPase
MLQKELIKRSPLRVLENSIHGGVGEGNIGIIAARKGIGKTACLVHIATDQLFQGKHVIHVSFSENTSHIITWYEDIFNEIAKRNNLENVMEIHDELVRSRIIMNFIQDGIHISAIEKSILRLIENGHFSADVVVIDGYDFSRSSAEEMREFKTFAKNLKLEFWFSATVIDSDFDGSCIPSLLTQVKEEVVVIICLQQMKKYIHLNLVKDHDSIIVKDTHLKLDPEILLIAEE